MRIVTLPVKGYCSVNVPSGLYDKVRGGWLGVGVSWVIGVLPSLLPKPYEPD
jgi:hypothetical protein